MASSNTAGSAIDAENVGKLIKHAKDTHAVGLYWITYFKERWRWLNTTSGVVVKLYAIDGTLDLIILFRDGYNLHKK